MKDGHAMIGTGILLLVTWGGVAAGWGTLKQRVDTLTEQKVEQDREIDALKRERDTLKETVTRMDENVKQLVIVSNENKSELRTINATLSARRRW